MEKASETIKLKRIPFCSAVIVAGGSSTRFGADKLFVELDGVPVLGRSIEAFASAPCIREIVVVAREGCLNACARLARAYGGGKVSVIVPGGETRVLSSYAGVMSVSPKAKLIAIHDGARPLVTGDVILNAVWGAYRHVAAAPAVPVRDTIRVAWDGIATATPERRSLFAVQTPQVFRAEVIKAALTSAADCGAAPTDDCAAVEALGARVTLTPGSEENIKLTTPLDRELAESILRRRA